MPDNSKVETAGKASIESGLKVSNVQPGNLLDLFLACVSRGQKLEKRSKARKTFPARNKLLCLMCVFTLATLAHLQ